jgi:hypothetical protein
MRRLGLVLAVLIVAGCAESAVTPRVGVEAKREWISNITVVIGQLQEDVAQTQLIGSTPAAAQAALRDESALYALLVAYSDLAGCRHIVASAGAPPRRAAAPVDEPLVAACVHLERASALFTEAATHDDGLPLAAATREARRALPSLARAAAALARVTQSQAPA